MDRVLDKPIEDINVLKIVSEQISNIKDTIFNHVDFSHLTANKKQLQKLEILYEQISELYKCINETRNSCKDIIAERIHKFKEVLHIIENNVSDTPVVEQNWSKIATTGQSSDSPIVQLDSRQSAQLDNRSSAQPIVQLERTRTSPEMTDVQVAPGVTLKCILIPSVKHIPKMPLYYITAEKKFAMNIAGKIIKGNLGEIYTNEEVRPHDKKIIRVKNCNILGCMSASCTYYHPTRPGDIRNYIMKEWIYTSPKCRQYTNPYVRHIGSSSTLASDIPKISIEERERIYDQTMHDLLLALSLMDTRIGHTVGHTTGQSVVQSIN